MSEGTAKKEERRKFQAIKGTRDLLPPETALWNRVEQIAQKVFASYGFSEIRLPIFEPTELFARSIGLDTDVVSKEMFSFTDPANVIKSLVQDALQAGLGVDLKNFEQAFQSSIEEKVQFISLRPEATASVCRAYIENNMQQLPQPVKLYTFGPMFRRERPQKGRYRQFYQVDAEVLGGSDAPGIDAELIEMVMTFFDRLGLEGVQLDINCIGDKKCRPKYAELLRAELSKVKDKLGPDSQRRIETNPLRVLDSKLESEQKLIEGMPHIADHLCEECAENYRGVKKELELRGVNYRENWRLVRGLDYYSRTTFEITAKGLGSQNAVCGGGRYDGLMELLGGPPTRATGFAIGEDRLILSLQEAGKTPAPQGRDVYIAWMGEKAYATAVRVAKNLRAAGLSVELPPVEQKFGKALGQADKLGARYALILGDNEVSSGEWTLKTLATGEQAKFKEADLLDHLRKARGLSS
ncbi:MAG: histidine--tRNA ligase [Acidobacteria bacterium]|nr:MAG: histidine--tRNA ligase [Acidobacteriota bacterium]